MLFLFFHRVGFLFSFFLLVFTVIFFVALVQREQVVVLLVGLFRLLLSNLLDPLRLLIFFLRVLSWLTSLTDLVEHLKFGVLFGEELLGELEVFNEHALDSDHELVVFVVVDHVVVEGFLRLLVPAQDHGDACQQTLFLDVGVL